MVPAAFVTMPALPMTPNGKLDRAALPVPAHTATATAAPRNPRQDVLCRLFAAVLGLPEVGTGDNFFDLGGHSLLATRLVNRIRATLGVDLGVRDLFANPTVATLEPHLTAGLSRPPLGAVTERPDPLPLSFAQRRLWFLYGVEGPSATYNVPVTTRLHGPVDVDALRAAVDDLVDRHEILRTVYAETDGEPVQRILDPAPGTFTHHTVTPDQAETLLATASAHPFDLTREAPLAVHLISTGEHDHLLLVNLHHIAGDGVSMAPLAQDLADAYAARLAGHAPDWAPLPVQYADYALWQRTLLGADDDPTSEVRRQLDYWGEALAGLPDELPLPTDHPRPARASYRAGRVDLTIDPTTHQALRAVARNHDATLFMVVQAAIATLLTRLGAPHVDWSAGAVTLATEATPWPETGRPRRAAVSSFGISGTNAHVIIEQPPVEVVEGEIVDPALPDALVPVLVSARSAAALAGQADRWARWLAADERLRPVDVGWSSVTTRPALEYRALLTATDRDDLLLSLRALAAGEPSGAVVTGAAAVRGRVALLFSGQGAQRAGMGRELYSAFPVFAAALDEVCGHLDALLPQPLKTVLFAEAGSAEAALVDQTVFTQAGLFAVEVALFRLVESFGVVPDFVGGHSVGEITAAYVAGVLSLADACALVAARGRLMQALPTGGGMLAVAAPEADVVASIEGLSDRVGIAAVNGPSAVVVSGAADALHEVEATWRERGARTRRLAVSHAFHSPLMEPMLGEFRAVLAGLTFAAPLLPVVSNLTGALADVDELRTPEYWVRHVRRRRRRSQPPARACPARIPGGRARGSRGSPAGAGGCGVVGGRARWRRHGRRRPRSGPPTVPSASAAPSTCWCRRRPPGTVPRAPACRRTRFVAPRRPPTRGGRRQRPGCRGRRGRRCWRARPSGARRRRRSRRSRRGSGR
ncbi:condensation domain-containing protein [Micromonospora echinospora]